MSLVRSSPEAAEKKEVLNSFSDDDPLPETKNYKTPPQNFKRGGGTKINTDGTTRAPTQTIHKWTVHW